MKEKVAIITLNGYHNYGNRLQNYALQEFIRMHDFECETIINSTYLPKTELNNMTFLKKVQNMSLENIIRKICKKKFCNISSKREKIFKDFTLQYIKETDYSINTTNIHNFSEKDYKYFIAGSDQVWNPFDTGLSELSFLNFAQKHKRISYAASFGVYNIPKEYTDDYKKWLSGMNYISVREEAGASIVKELTGREVPVVIDPTMILTKEQWLKISKKSEFKPKRKYILTYLLGGGSKEQKLNIKKIAKRNNLEIVNLGDIKDKKHYVTGPSEFIDYINDASVFFTDSFHGCVFSMLLDTPFIVCNRVGQNESTSMESRIDTFLNKFNLESRRYSNMNDINIFECDYTKSYDLLEEEREKANNYLKMALKL